MAVVGGGVIGCEYACMFAALGVQVHLIDPRPGLLPFLDAEMGERLADAMRSLGITLHLERTHEHVERGPAGLTCTLSSGEALVVETVMVAAGRQGNTDGLELPAIGVEVDARGYVKVDEDFRTAVPGVYAAGDVVGFPSLASVSMEQGRVAVCHAFGFTYKRQVSDLLPYGVYTIPEVSCVGLGEEEAARRGLDVVAGRAFYRDNVRGQIMSDRDGMVKLVFDRSHAPADRLPLHRRTRVRARPRGAGDHRAGRHGRDVHRDGLQPPDARRDVQVRRVRRARPARSGLANLVHQETPLPRVTVVFLVFRR